MACCDTPLVRIEKIKKNQIINPGSSPYNQSPGMGQQRTMQGNMQTGDLLPAEEMTPIVDINETQEEVVDPVMPGMSTTLPELIPNAPTFNVPANPLLPPGYQEVLDYNSIQYANGFYRTQIGRYVRVEQLMGSNSVVSKEGYLIGVGINYIILQEASTGSIQVIDIYGVKSMYVYYNLNSAPERPGALSQE